MSRNVLCTFAKRPLALRRVKVVQRIAFPKALKTDPEAERREHMNISLLVPAPEKGDELVAAIPVVAPWNALSRCKYKVKLQPGNGTKGRAMREIVGVWTGLANRGPKIVDETNREKEKVWLREIDLLKGWKVEGISAGGQHCVLVAKPA